MPVARSLPPLIEAFLDMIAAERGASKNTQDAYARDLADYAAGLARAGKTPQNAATGDIRAYLSLLAERGLKPASSARKLSSIRQFHRFLVTDGRRADDPALIIEAPRRGRRLPKILSIAEVGHLLAVSKEGLDDGARPVAERLRALRTACLLELLYATGLRVSELVALPAGAAQTKDPFLHIRGKGGRERLVPLSGRGARSDRGLSRLSQDNAGRGVSRPLAVSRRWRERPSDASGFRPRSQSLRGRGRHCRGAGQPACAPSCLREPSCCKMALICASCRNCSGTPIFQQRKFIPMCSMSG